MSQQGSYRSTMATDIVTYRHGDKLVYVKPADTYELALDIAQKEFKEDLGNIHRDRIGFAVLSTFGGEKQPVRISESAWPGAVARLMRGEIIDVYIRADPQNREPKEIPPPQYLEVPKVTVKEADPKRPGHVRQSKSNPSSRANSPSLKENRRSWFGNTR